ncbi:hypothetical protein LCM20_16185 [Halobacillus litoralis]|uniref:hypothetical protein n=1 Tax=Halobacillus litoralis TaxID=45668 RepID=UPI001CD4BAF9|nr:hypothetical protein [Halobacillus litoralis]MCA0972147.1 hypothetical protein [Halobacillus litoralis]
MLTAFFIITILGLFLFSVVAISLSSVQKRDVERDGYKVWMDQMKAGTIRIDYERRRIETPDLELGFGQVTRLSLVEAHDYTDVYLFYTNAELMSDWLQFSIHKKSTDYQPNETFIQQLQRIADSAGGECEPVEKLMDDETIRLSSPLRKIAQSLKVMGTDERRDLEAKLNTYQLRTFVKKEMQLISYEGKPLTLRVREGFRFYSPDCEAHFMFLHTFDTIYLAEVCESGEVYMLYEEKEDRWFAEELWRPSLQADIWFIARVLSDPAPLDKSTINKKGLSPHA